MQNSANFETLKCKYGKNFVHWEIFDNIIVFGKHSLLQCCKVECFQELYYALELCALKKYLKIILCNKSHSNILPDISLKNYFLEISSLLSVMLTSKAEWFFSTSVETNRPVIFNLFCFYVHVELFRLVIITLQYIKKI